MIRALVHACPRPRGLLMLAALVALSACEGQSPTDGDNGTDLEPTLPTFTLTPTSAVPGQPVELGGEFIVSLVEAGTDFAEEEITFQVGGLAGTLRVLPDGRVAAGVPGRIAGDDGQSPPDGPQEAALLRAGQPVAEGEDWLTIQALPDAPGTSHEVVEALDNLAVELQRVAGLFSEPGSPEYGYATAVIAALDSLLTGQDPGSLASQLAAAEPADRAVIDNFLAAGQVLEWTRLLSETYSQLAVGAEAEVAAARAEPLPAAFASYELPAGAEEISDLSLARKMQAQVVLERFAADFVSGTSTGLGGVGSFLGAVNVGIGVNALPPLATIGAVVGIVDFIANKVLVGLNPSQVTELVLDPVQPRIEYNQETAARVWIEAQNTPPQVGINDMVGLTMSVLGVVPGVAGVRQLQEFLNSTAGTFIGIIQSELGFYASLHPELDLDISFSFIPTWTWAAQVTDRRFMEPVTFTPEILAPVDGAVNWTSGETAGEGRVAVRTATGTPSHVISTPPGFEYNGGAFGESVRQSETRSIFVEGALWLAIAEAPETLQGDEIGTVLIEAGATYGDSLPPVAGIDLELSAEGGQVQPATGVTDADGQFIATVQLLPDSESMTLRVTATNEFGESLADSVEIGVPVVDVEWFENSTWLRVSSDAAMRDPDIEDSDRDDEFVPSDDFTSGSHQASAGANVSDGTDGARGSASGSLDWSFSEAGGVYVAQAQHTSNADAEWDLPTREGTAVGHVDARLGFKLRAAPGIPYTLSITVSGDRPVRFQFFREGEFSDFEILQPQEGSYTISGTLDGTYTLGVWGGASAGGGDRGSAGSEESTSSFTARLELGGT